MDYDLTITAFDEAYGGYAITCGGEDVGQLRVTYPFGTHHTAFLRELSLEETWKEKLDTDEFCFFAYDFLKAQGVRELLYECPFDEGFPYPGFIMVRHDLSGDWAVVTYANKYFPRCDPEE